MRKVSGREVKDIQLVGSRSEVYSGSLDPKLTLSIASFTNGVGVGQYFLVNPTQP